MQMERIPAAGLLQTGIPVCRRVAGTMPFAEITVKIPHTLAGVGGQKLVLFWKQVRYCFQKERFYRLQVERKKEGGGGRLIVDHILKQEKEEKRKVHWRSGDPGKALWRGGRSLSCTQNHYIGNEYVSIGI